MATEEDLEETGEEEEEEERPSRAIGRGRGRAGGGIGGAGTLSEIIAWASRHRVPLMVGGGFLFAYWVGHRRGKRAAAAPTPVTQIYLPPQGGGFRTGIQSSSPMYDPRFYDFPDGVDAY